MTLSRSFRIYGLETKCEVLKLVRTPVYLFSTLLFPLIFYVFFGLIMGRSLSHGAFPIARYILATYGTFGVVAAALYGFGIGLAVERGMGWLEIKQASPAPPVVHLAAKTTACLLLSAIVIVLLFSLGALAGGVRMPAAQWLLLASSLTLGAAPFCAMGLAIGYFSGPKSAPAIVNLIYMPMAFCSGLWIPIDFLPRQLQQAAEALPTYHLAQIGLAILKSQVRGTVAGHVGALAGFTLLFAGIAWLGYRRERERIYG